MSGKKDRVDEQGTTLLIAELDDGARRELSNFYMDRFLGDTCRICGRLIEAQDLESPDGIKFAGRHEPGKRAAHLRCWEGMIETILDAPADKLAALLR